MKAKWLLSQYKWYLRWNVSSLGFSQNLLLFVFTVRPSMHKIQNLRTIWSRSSQQVMKCSIQLSCGAPPLQSICYYELTYSKWPVPIYPHSNSDYVPIQFPHFRNAGAEEIRSATIGSGRLYSLFVQNVANQRMQHSIRLSVKLFQHLNP